MRRIRLGVVAVLLVGAAQSPSQTGQAPLRPLAVTQLDERPQGNDLDSGRPVTITLSDPTPITELLLMLVRGTRLSVVPDPDVQGTFRGDLKNVTLRQALEMILQPHGFDYSVQGNLIRVFKRRLETRRFDLNYVVTRRTGSRTLSASNSILASGSPGMSPGTSENGQGSSVEITGTDAETSSATCRPECRRCCRPTGASTWTGRRRCCRPPTTPIASTRFSCISRRCRIARRGRCRSRRRSSRLR